MRDLIDRQALIDSLLIADVREVQQFCYPCKKILDAIKAQPSAQPTQTNTPNALESLDSVSRQAAIDAVKCGALSAATLYGRTDAGSTALFETVKAIKAIPSAQPEIIRCKDCAKHEYCRTSTVWAIPPKDDWYCADAERRTDE